MSSKNGIWLKISGISGISSPIITFTFVLLAISYSPQFSWTENALSDLGVQEGITAPLFNFGLIIGGILTLMFAFGLFLFLREKMLGKIGASIFILDAIALSAIGFFPENAKPMHYYASVAFFVLSPASMLVISTVFLLMDKVRMGLFTFLTAISAAIVWAMQWTIGFGSNVAIPEALSALSVSTWSIVLSLEMLKKASHSNKSVT